MARAKRTRRATGRTRVGAAADDLGRRAVEAAMRLAAAKGWRHVTLGAVAGECRVPLAALYRVYPSRAAILAGFARMIDGQVLAAGAVGADAGSARDRLFEVMMRRYEALTPYREAIASIAGDALHDPLPLLCLAGAMRRSMAWMFEAAGISSGGPKGLLKAKGLALVHVAVMRVWLNDTTKDLARTMAALDRALKFVEPIAETLFGRRRAGRAAKVA